MFKENFTRRHIGPDPSELNIMLKKIGVKSIEELLEQTIPDKIRIKGDLKIPNGISEIGNAFPTSIGDPFPDTSSAPTCNPVGAIMYLFSPSLVLIL